MWKEEKMIRRYLPYQCPSRDLSVPSPSPRMAAPLDVVVGQGETSVNERRWLASDVGQRETSVNERSWLTEIRWSTRDIGQQDSQTLHAAVMSTTAKTQPSLIQLSADWRMFVRG